MAQMWLVSVRALVETVWVLKSGSPAVKPILSHYSPKILSAVVE